MKSLTTLVLVCAAFGCERPVTPAPPSASTTPASATPAAPPITPTAAPSAAPPSASAASAGPVESTTFDGDELGAPAPAFDGVVGDWYVADEAFARGLKVDGSKWRSGTPSANLADQAKRLYGDRYAEFLDGVKAFAFFPFAIRKSDPPAGDLKVSVRFYPIAGKIDQAAGIAFAIAPDGTYLGFRANALEDNLLYFRVVKGKRTILDTVRNVPTPTKTWHTLSLELRGKQLSAELDGQKRFEKTLDQVPQGRVGLWSKADSQVLFDDFKVEALTLVQAAPKTNPALDP
jgi:hypothetical protein